VCVCWAAAVGDDATRVEGIDGVTPTACTAYNMHRDLVAVESDVVGRNTANKTI
jgi:hypothetical protein